MAVLATLLCYWVFLLLVPLIAYFVVVTVYFLRHPKYRGIDFDDVKGLIELNEMDILSKAFGKLIGLTLAMVLTALTITANVHPSLKMPGLAMAGEW